MIALRRAPRPASDSGSPEWGARAHRNRPPVADGMRRLVLALAVVAASFGAPAAGAQDAPALAAALDRVAVRDWDGAFAAADRAGPDGQPEIARDIVDWHRLRAGEGDFADYPAFLARRADWPGLPLLRARGERTIPAGADPSRVIAYFDGTPPQTPEGSAALIAAFEAIGAAAAARDEAQRYWREGDPDAEVEARLLASYDGVLAPHHVARLDRLLWDGAAAAAERMVPLVPGGWQRLARARMALRAEAAGVDALISAVPADLAADPGLAWERVRWRLANGLTDSAVALVLAHSESDAGLGRPEAWAGFRTARARAEMRAGDPVRAYRLAADHRLTEGAAFADLEWLAGFIALRRLDDPGRALRHFQALRLAVTTPISLGRAGYWEGRAHEALGEVENARAAYAFGAEHQSAYYGQLAADRAGLPFDASLAAVPRPLPDWRRADIAGSSVLQAALALHAAGDRMLARRFLLHLGESQDAAGYRALAAVAETLNEPNFAVLIAKQAAGAGVILPDAYFPTADIVPDGLAVPRALALAIARRESEFDAGAVSPAGARGLMQVMPATADLMAGALGLDFDVARLTADPAYNAALGAGYLARLIDEFGDAPVLVAAGYNAGPGRPRRWIEELGDPRRADVDPVDWVEHVPFTETRNYIMRVLESLVVYHARLGDPSPPRLSDLLGGN